MRKWIFFGRSVTARIWWRPESNSKGGYVMRLLLCAALLLSIIVVAGCVMPNAPVGAGLVIDQKGPVSGFDNDVGSSKVGTAKAEGILIVGYGDASIKTAADKAEITKIHHVDCEILNILGIYARYETVVYGE
jgi:hypothetical protein